MHPRIYWIDAHACGHKGLACCAGILELDDEGLVVAHAENVDCGGDVFSGGCADGDLCVDGCCLYVVECLHDAAAASCAKWCIFCDVEFEFAIEC